MKEKNRDPQIKIHTFKKTTKKQGRIVEKLRTQLEAKRCLLSNASRGDVMWNIGKKLCPSKCKYIQKRLRTDTKYVG